MAKKVTLENLDSEIKKILDEYGDEVNQNLDIITKRIGQKGAQALKNESLSEFPNSKKHKQRYGQTWTYEVEKKRLYTAVTIYNKQAGLPHLLENGHALVAGGRSLGQVPGHEHIAPIADKLEQEYEAEVKAKL
jgi:hypothetical protein